MKSENNLVEKSLFPIILLTLFGLVLLAISFACADTKHMIKYYDKMYARDPERIEINYQQVGNIFEVEGLVYKDTTLVYDTYTERHMFYQLKHKECLKKHITLHFVEERPNGTIWRCARCNGKVFIIKKFKKHR